MAVTAELPCPHSCPPPHPPPEGAPLQASWQCCGCTNSSSCASSMPATLLAVYDGHGGAGASQYLADHLHVHLLHGTHAALAASPDCCLNSSAVQHAWSEAMHAANQQLLRRPQLRGGGGAAAAQLPGGVDDGSTAVVALMAGQQLLVANIGNSRALICQLPPPGGSGIDDGTSGGAAASAAAAQEGSGASLSRAERTAAQRRRARQQARQRQQGDRRTDADAQAGGGAPCLGEAWLERVPPWALCPLVPLPLSFDHKPGRRDECERIFLAGGSVDLPGGSSGGSWDGKLGSHAAAAAAAAAACAELCSGPEAGQLRLAGELEISRAFGDAQYVGKGLSAEPEFRSHMLQVILVPQAQGAALHVPATLLHVCFGGGGRGQSLSCAQLMCNKRSNGCGGSLTWQYAGHGSGS